MNSPLDIDARETRVDRRIQLNGTFQRDERADSRDVGEPRRVQFGEKRSPIDLPRKEHGPTRIARRRIRGSVGNRDQTAFVPRCGELPPGRPENGATFRGKVYRSETSRARNPACAELTAKPKLSRSKLGRHGRGRHAPARGLRDRYILSPDHRALSARSDNSVRFRTSAAAAHRNEFSGNERAPGDLNGTRRSRRKKHESLKCESGVSVKISLIRVSFICQAM